MTEDLSTLAMQAAMGNAPKPHPKPKKELSDTQGCLGVLLVILGVIAVAALSVFAIVYAVSWAWHAGAS